MGNTPSEQIDYFPNEVHNVRLVKTEFKLPGRWTYKPGTSNIHYNGVSIQTLSDAFVVPTYDGTNTVFTMTNDGSWFYGDITARWRNYAFGFSALPDCDVPTGLVNFTKTSNIINYYYAVNPAYRIPQTWVQISTGTTSPTYYNVAKAFTPITPSYIAKTNTAEWDVRFENTTNYTDPNKDITNAWMLISSPSGGITPTALRPIISGTGATAVLGSPIVLTQVGTSNQWYAQLGTIPGGSSTNYRILANYTSCANDNLNVTVGNNFSRYPTVVGNSYLYQQGDFMCDTKDLSLALQPKKIKLETVLTQPTVPQVFCTNIPYSFNVKNLDEARSYNNVVKLEVPVGLVYAPGTSSFTYNGTTVNPGDPVLVAGFLTWTLPVATMPALGGFGDTIPNEYDLAFETKTVCGFISGSRFNIKAEGKSGCGATDVSSVFSNPILLTVATAFTNVYAIATNTDNTITCGVNRTVVVNFNHVSGTPTIAGEFIEVIIPNNFGYQGNIVAINNAAGATFISDTPNMPSVSKRTLRFQMPAGITAGQTVNFSFEVSLTTPADYACNDIANITARTVIEGATLTCEGNTCNIQAVTSESANEEITVVKPTYNIESLSGAFTGTTYSGSISVKNTSTLNQLSSNPVKIDFYCANASGVATGQALGTYTMTSTILAGATGTENFSFAGVNCSVTGRVVAVINTANNCVCSASTTSTLFCFKDSVVAGTALDTKHGITSLSRAGADNGNWPMVRKGAWTALESKTKGFVVNRLDDTEMGAIPAANLVIGMMIYNTTQDCLMINTDATAAGWKCFKNQACPD